MSGDVAGGRPPGELSPEDVYVTIWGAIRLTRATRAQVLTWRDAGELEAYAAVGHNRGKYAGQLYRLADVQKLTGEWKGAPDGFAT